jgi:hypothetical protein
MDTNTKSQASKIVAAEIAKLPANTPMDHGTLGASQKLTKREGQAKSMALYFVKRMTGMTTFGDSDRRTPEQAAALADVDEIAAAAVEIAGK